MTDQRRTTLTQKTPAPSIMTEVADFHKAGFGPGVWFPMSVFKNVNDMGAEVVQFVADRFEEDIRLQNEIFKCKDLAQLFEIQVRFFETAVDQYTKKTEELAQMGSEILDVARYQEPG